MNLPPPASQHCADQSRWFAEEVRPHEPALRAWLRSRYPSLSDVDDIVQESYLRLLRARQAGPIDSAKAYLFGIARHVALGVFRKNRNSFNIAVNSFADSDTLEASGDVVEAVSIRQESALAVDAIKSLPDRCREIVTLRTLHHFSYQEIALRLGLSEDTVRVQMARGIKKCALYLRERGVNNREGHEVS